MSSKVTETQDWQQFFPPERERTYLLIPREAPKAVEQNPMHALVRMLEAVPEPVSLAMHPKFIQEWATESYDELHARLVAAREAQDETARERVEAALADLAFCMLLTDAGEHVIIERGLLELFASAFPAAECSIAWKGTAVPLRFRQSECDPQEVGQPTFTGYLFPFEGGYGSKLMLLSL